MTRRRRKPLGRTCVLVAVTALSTTGAVGLSSAGAAGLASKLRPPDCTWPVSSTQINRSLGVRVQNPRFPGKPLPLSVGGLTGSMTMCTYGEDNGPAGKAFVVIIEYVRGLGTAGTFRNEEKAFIKSKQVLHVTAVSGIGSEAFMASTATTTSLEARVGTTIFTVTVPGSRFGPRLVALSRVIARAL